MEAREYNFVKYKVRKLMNMDLDSYKTQQVQRRLRTYLTRSGHTNWPNFFRAIQDDTEALDKFKNYLTINVSAFFRDPEKFEHLRTSILPDLLSVHPKLNIWSAGCSYGYEPYTLAMLLAEVTGPYRPHKILATDIDRAALTLAQNSGPYTAKQVENISSLLLQRYFQKRPDGYYVSKVLRRRITFQYHNLLCDPFESDFDLIVCRNVVIYFQNEAKNILYQRFHDALRPGGVLFLGGTEVLSKASDRGFDTLSVSFYRRHVEAE